MGKSQDKKKSNQIFSNGFTDSLVDKSFMAFAPYLLFEPEAILIRLYSSK
jgi:hypothetical protein